jgi:hypothetical protein
MDFKTRRDGNSMKIPLGEYLPDLPSFGNPGATEAKNVLPFGVSYQPWPSLNLYSNALTARCQGAAYGKDADGNTFNFSGDATKLYKLSSASWADISVGGGYATLADGRWFFSNYNTRMLATNFANAIQTFTMGTSSAFANLSASAPKARYITAARDFIIVGNTFDSVDGNMPNRIRWSAVGDPTNWTVSATTQADYQDLDSSKGWVQQVIGGEYVVVFQERAINRMTYAGSPVVFQFDEVETGRGLLAPGSAVKFGNFIAYLGIDGFYVFDGNQSVSIGENKINKTFFTDVDTGYFDRIASCVDLDKQIIYWAYPGAGNTVGLCNKILAYNYSQGAVKRWSYAEVNTEVIYISLSEGYTLDSLDSLSSSIDALPIYLDSRFYTGDNYILSAFDSSHRLNTFTGSAMTATIETSEAEMFEGSRAFVTLIRPIVDGTGTTTVQIGTRNLLSDSISWGSAISLDSLGEAQCRSTARYHRARLNISGGFNHAQGIEVLKATQAGVR